MVDLSIEQRIMELNKVGLGRLKISRKLQSEGVELSERGVRSILDKLLDSGLLERNYKYRPVPVVGLRACLLCGAIIPKGRSKFCSRDCQVKFNNNRRKNTMRKRNTMPGKEAILFALANKVEIAKWCQVNGRSICSIAKKFKISDYAVYYALYAAGFQEKVPQRVGKYIGRQIEKLEAPMNVPHTMQNEQNVANESMIINSDQILEAIKKMIEERESKTQAIAQIAFALKNCETELVGAKKEISGLIDKQVDLQAQNVKLQREFSEAVATNKRLIEAQIAPFRVKVDKEFWDSHKELSEGLH